MILPDLWDLLAAESDDDDDLDTVVLFTDADTLARRSAEIESLRSQVETLDVKQLADGCLPRLAANLVHAGGINLLQGRYAPKSNYAALARPWRIAASLLLAWLGAMILGEALTVFKLSRDEAQLSDAIGAVCASSYASTQLNACRLEMMRRLDAAGQAAGPAGAGYLATQALVAEAGGTALRMESMSYRDGVLNLVFLAPDAPFVDTFAQSVSASGQFQVIDPSTSAEANGVRTRLRIAPVVQ
jgi:type II secretory pathway component PulL